MGVVKISLCVGCGLKIGGTGLLEVELRPSGGIGCTNTGAADDGLFVTFPPSTVVTSNTGDDCVQLTGNGAAGTPLSTSLIISPDACNGVQCRGNGLYAFSRPNDKVGIYPELMGGFAGPYPLAVGVATYRFFGPDHAVFNNSTCCTMAGFVKSSTSVDVVANGMSWISAQTGFVINGVDALGAPLKDAHADTRTSSAGGSQLFQLGGEDSLIASIPPGGSSTFATLLIVTGRVGTGSILSQPAGELAWHIGCSDPINT